MVLPGQIGGASCRMSCGERGDCHRAAGRYAGHRCWRPERGGAGGGSQAGRRRGPVRCATRRPTRCSGRCVTSALDHSGVICVERLDAALTGQPPLAADRGALRRETVPVWERCRPSSAAGRQMPRAFTSCWPVAELIGAVGLITNSQVLIVAAMVVGPEYYAIIAVALGISSRDRSAVRDGLLALLWGFLAPIAVTLLFGLASGDRGRPRRCSWPASGRSRTSSTPPDVYSSSWPGWRASWAWCP